MQELYFHQLKNRDVGPLSANEIRQRIRAGQIQTSDRLRVEGEAHSRPAGEFLAFRDEIERISAQESNGRRWVCLRAGNFKAGTTSAMCGPYTRGEIVDLLLRNELSPTDFVWREGFTSWKSLNSVDQLRLPIPNFPRPGIAWKSVNLDWDTNTRSQTRVHAAPVQNLGILDDIGEKTLIALFTVVCGLMAVVMWRFFTPRMHAVSNFRSAPKATAPVRRPELKKTAASAKKPATDSKKPAKTPAAIKPVLRR